MTPATPLSDFVSVYVGHIKTRLRSWSQIHGRLRRLISHFPPEMQFGSVRRHDILGYIEKRQVLGASTASINIEIATFSSAFNYCCRRWEMDLANPVVGLYFPSLPGRLRYLEHDEAARLIECARNTRSKTLPFFLVLALHTGCRKSELLQMQWKSIDFSRSIITVEAWTTKTGKRRYLPMNLSARQALISLQAYRDQIGATSPYVFLKSNGDRWCYPERAFKKAIDLAGIQDFTVHDLRHTFASWLVSEGVELIKVRDLLGHSSIRMTERYAHLAPLRLHDAVAVLDRVSAQPSTDRLLLY